ncbi:MAG: hypothetical protein HY784_02580 [Chloroflexi bacterium]|nr:hypothetical protein [Chloroflexota bacterium]
MSHPGTEDALEQAALALFAELGWRTVHALYAIRSASNPPARARYGG